LIEYIWLNRFVLLQNSLKVFCLTELVCIFFQSIDATWKTLHEHAMKNAWKPPETASGVLKDSSSLGLGLGQGARVQASLPLQQYPFETDNPYLSRSHLATQSADSLSSAVSSAEQRSCDDLYDQGMQYYREGHIDEAILAFEGAIQIHPEQIDNMTVSENTEEPATAVDEVWNMLGKCHAEMDKDAEAIFCHRQALESDPFNLSALLALGTSHVNEMNSEEALECLQGWVKHNPKFHGLEARLKKQYNTDTADDVYAGEE
jgi:tetratricopeptide (TPR) repeat protein